VSVNGSVWIRPAVVARADLVATSLSAAARPRDVAASAALAYARRLDRGSEDGPRT
jgi:hypothetical protein